MGIFIEDLLNFGNLIDAELEIKLSAEELSKAYSGFEFDIRDGILKILKRKKVLFFNKTQEVRLSEVDRKVKKDRETSRQWVFFKVLSKDVIEDLQKLEVFSWDGEYLGLDVMPAVVLTETYEKIPKQFREKLLINRYKIGKDYLSVFFKFEK